MKEFPAWYEEVATKLCDAVFLIKDAGLALSDSQPKPRTAAQYLLAAAHILTASARSVDERFPPKKKPGGDAAGDN
jgi:hypothetical protein